MYNRFPKYFLENKSIDPRNLVFKLVIKLTSQLFNLTIKYLKLLEIICIRRTCLLTFQKVFQIVDHMILPKELSLYGIRVKNPSWIKSRKIFQTADNILK